MKTKSTSLAEGASVTDCCCKAAPIGDGSRRYVLANARQWRQSHLNKPVIGWVPDKGPFSPRSTPGQYRWFKLSDDVFNDAFSAELAYPIEPIIQNFRRAIREK